MSGKFKVVRGSVPPSGPSEEAKDRVAHTTEFAAAIVGPDRTSFFHGLWGCSHGDYLSPRGNAGVCAE